MLLYMGTNIQFFIITHSFLLRMRNVWDKSWREIQNTHFVLRNFFFSKIVPFMRQCGKLLYIWAGHRWQYGLCELHAGYLRLQIHTLRLCNTHCFSTAAMVALTCLNVTFYVHWLSCSLAQTSASALAAVDWVELATFLDFVVVFAFLAGW